MPSRQIQSITERLPPSLKGSVNGYVDAVAAAIPDIARESGVEITGETLDQVLLIVAVRRIWASVNSQFWIMNDCIAVATRVDPNFDGPPQTRGFRIGRDEISQGSAAFTEGRNLRQEFYELIVKLGIQGLVAESASLTDIVREMAARRG
jgi:hypothetical protein